MKRVVIGSENPIKIRVTEEVFNVAFPDEEFEFISFKAESRVSSQPMGSKETRLGSKNRAQACRNAYPEADYFVGHEGGLEEDGGEMWATAWMCVLDNAGKYGFGKASSFLLPDRIRLLVKQGKELAHAGDAVFNENNIGQKGGVVSILTKDNVTRKSFYKDAMIFALIPFINPELYRGD